MAKKEMTLITHAGKFHADEVMATAILRLAGMKGPVKRVNSAPEESDDIIIYDIGGGRYDHHQENKHMRDDRHAYAACGLIWRSYGKKIVSSKEILKKIDDEIMAPIDAIDNGEKKGGALSFSKIIDTFNPAYDEDTTEIQQIYFEKAVSYAEETLKNAIRQAEAELRSRTEAGEIIKNSISQKNYVLLDPYLPWEETLYEIEGHESILYMVFPSNRGGWMIWGVPKTKNGFDTKKLLPKNCAEWEGVSFCHPGRFCCGTASKEDAIKVVEKAIES